MRILTSVLAIIILLSSCSQQVNTVDNARTEMGVDEQSGITVNIPGHEMDVVRSDWTDLMKEEKAVTYGNDDEVFADNAVINGISDGTIDLFALFDRHDSLDLVEMRVWVQDETGETEGLKAETKQYVRQFAHNLAFGKLKKLQTEKQSKIDELQEQKSKLQADNKGLQEQITEHQAGLEQSEIEEYKSKIKENDERIDSLNDDIDELRAELQILNNQVDGLKL